MHLILAAAGLLAGCAGGVHNTPPTDSDLSPGVMPKPTGVIRDVQPWSFEGASGQAITTDHFILYTTERSSLISQRMPTFLEAALAHYQTAVTPLPVPSQQIETFVMDSRAQWQALTIKLLGDKGVPVTAIKRGGFTTKGRSLLFDIGSVDTMAIAAHESWHAYTQLAFAEALPVWMEEGLATYMEGYRWSGPGASAEFLGWANLPRFDKLREAVNKNHLRPLAEVLAASPNQMIGMDGGRLAANADAPVLWYSQVWALTHFLLEGENGKYAASFKRCMNNAAAGTMRSTVAASAPGGRVLASTNAVQVFRVYLDADIERVDAEYQAFMRRAVALGGREAVSVGRSPVAEMK